MADIQSEILNKFGINIVQENIFKLYKIESPNLSPQDLETKIDETRKRWETSINGANEKNAQRDRLRLEQADKYEAVLRDNRYRMILFNYYNNTAGAGADDSIDFAKEYFTLIATAKRRINKEDVDFFFAYYQTHRKSKSAIYEMLGKDFKVRGLGKEGADTDGEEEESEEKKKGGSSPGIVNLFQKETILEIRKAIDKYEIAQNSPALCMDYPKLRNGLYEFLEIKDIDHAKDFTSLMAEKGQKVYAVRQEKGTEYVPLVDLFNILKKLGAYQDVADNIPEFKLLLKYPNLTPYMFSFVEMKPSTIKGIMEIAKRDYAFRDETDFILNYYQPVHDNFNINNSKIESIVRKAQKKAKQNEVLNKIDEKLGRNKEKRAVPLGAEVIHWLVYWPIFAAYFIFEVAKTVFTKLYSLAIPSFFAFLIFFNWLFPKIFEMETLWSLRKIVSKAQWFSLMGDVMGDIPVNGFETILLSLITILFLLGVYIFPTLFAAQAIADFAEDFNKRFDWVGYERTFKNILQKLKQKSQSQFAAQKELFIKRMAPRAVINLLCVAFLFATVLFAPSIFGKLSEATGYGQELPEEAFAHQEEEQDTDKDEKGDDEENSEMPLGGIMVINTDSANIRSGAGTDYSVVATANMGDTFYATGNQATASNGRIWHEIYLDEELTQTGWASEKVIEFQ